MMSAWRFDSPGPPSRVLVNCKVPVPEVGAEQVLVRVRASAVNFADALFVRGAYQVRPEEPAVPGMELCGNVVAVGGQVPSHIELGMRVVGMPAVPHGTFAEYSVMHWTDALPAPQLLTDEHAAALTIAYQTGWFGLHRRAALQPGETLLVNAAAGGVGSAAVQLGLAAGAKVIGVVGGSEKVAAARELGCETAIDRRSSEVAASVLAATGGHGADVVYDPVGGDSFRAATRCVARGGRIVLVGFAAGERQSASVADAADGGYALVGLHWGLYRSREPHAVQAAHEILVGLVQTGRLLPWVTSVRSFTEAPVALDDVHGGRTLGRVVLKGWGRRADRESGSG